MDSSLNKDKKWTGSGCRYLLQCKIGIAQDPFNRKRTILKLCDKILSKNLPDSCHTVRKKLKKVFSTKFSVLTPRLYSHPLQRNIKMAPKVSHYIPTPSL